MPYQIKVQNKMGDWYQIFPEEGNQNHLGF